MRKILLLCTLLFLVVKISFAQVELKDTIDINDMLTKSLSHPDSGRYITKKALDKIITNNLFQIGGTGIKEGSLTGISTTITDKLISTNFNINIPKTDIFVQPTITLRNNEGVVDIFSKGKFTNENTYGLSIIWNNPKQSSAFFTPSDKYSLHNKLRIERIKFYSTKEQDVKNINGKIDAINQLFDSIINKNTLGNEFINFYDNKSQFEPPKHFINLLHLISSSLIELVDLGVISQSESQYNFSKINDLLKTKNSTSSKDEIVYSRYIEKQTEIQIENTNGKSIHWFRLSGNYNTQLISLADKIGISKPYDYLHEFASFSLFYNRQSIKKRGKNHFWSAGFEYSSVRNFNTDSLKILQVITPTNINGIAGNKVDEISFYDKKPERSNRFNIKGIYSFFDPDKDFGLEFTARAGVNNLNNNDREVTIGIFIPVGKNDEGSAILVQPNLNFSRLFNHKSDVFWQENFSFGILLSANISKLGKKRE